MTLKTQRLIRSLQKKENENEEIRKDLYFVLNVCFMRFL